MSCRQIYFARIASKRCHIFRKKLQNPRPIYNFNGACFSKNILFRHTATASKKRTPNRRLEETDNEEEKAEELTEDLRKTLKQLSNILGEDFSSNFPSHFDSNQPSSPIDVENTTQPSADELESMENEDNKSLVNNTLGVEAYNNKNLDEALQYFSKAIEYSNNNTIARLNKAAVLSDQNHVALALKEYERAGRIELSKPEEERNEDVLKEVYFYLLTYYMDKGSYVVAKNYLDKIRSIEDFTENQEMDKKEAEEESTAEEKEEIKKLTEILDIKEEELKSEMKLIESEEKEFIETCQRCDKMLKSILGDIDSIYQRKLAFPSTKKNKQNASSFNEHVQFDEKNNTLVASKDYSVGEEIWTESPLISFLVEKKDSNAELCSNCYKTINDIEYVEKSGAFSQKEFQGMFSDFKREFELFKDQIREKIGSTKPHRTTITIQPKKTIPFCSSECSHEYSATFPVHIMHNSAMVALMEKCLNEKNEVAVPVISLFAALFQQGLELNTHVSMIDTFPLWKMLNQLRFAENSDPILSEEENNVLEALKGIFPESFSSMLTPFYYFRLKSIVNLNAMSFSAGGVELTASLMPSTENSDVVDINMDTVVVEDVELAGLFQMASLLQHSCIPNVEMSKSVDGSKNIRFVAAKNIKAGEILSWDYLPAMTTDDKPTVAAQIAKRKKLYDHYYFWCNCPACKRALHQQRVGE